MSDPKRVGDGLEEFWKGFAERHNRPDVLEAFYEGASIWNEDGSINDNPHPNAWMSKHGSVEPEQFTPQNSAREAALEKAYEEGRMVKKIRQ